MVKTHLYPNNTTFTLLYIQSRWTDITMRPFLNVCSFIVALSSQQHHRKASHILVGLLLPLVILLQWEQFSEELVVQLLACWLLLSHPEAMLHWGESFQLHSLALGSSCRTAGVSTHANKTIS